MVNYDKFESALVRLEEQFHHYQNMDKGLPEHLQEALTESVIQRFETCYDALWKVLRKHLIEVTGLEKIPNGPKPVFRIANENELLHNPVEQWFDYNQARIYTSHDYDAEKTKACLDLISDFIEDAIVLRGEMTGRVWR